MNEKEIWVRFACAALSALDGLYGLKDSEKVRDECDSAALYADEMLEIYKSTFDEG